MLQVLDEGVSHSVTPLWCAAVSGRLREEKSYSILIFMVGAWFVGGKQKISACPALYSHRCLRGGRFALYSTVQIMYLKKARPLGVVQK